MRKILFGLGFAALVISFLTWNVFVALQPAELDLAYHAQNQSAQ